MDKILQNQRRIFRWISFTFEDSDAISNRLFFWISTILFIVNLEPQIYFIYKHIANIPLATEALGSVISWVVSIAKILLVYWHRTAIYDLLRALQQLGSHGKFVLLKMLF